MTKRKYRTDEEWLSLIQECRLSGLTDKQWCETHQICPSNFYYQIQKDIQCLSPAKKYKLYKSSINKSIHFVQRNLSSSTKKSAW